MEEFKQVRENLIAMLEDLDERLEKITADAKQLDTSPIKGGTRQEVELKTKPAFGFLEKASNIEVEKIQQAISRIDKGTYGICLSCGQPIKKQRLNDTPLSSQCIYCAGGEND